MTPDSSRLDLAALRQAVVTWWEAQGEELPLAAAEELALTLGRLVAQALLEAALARTTGKHSYQGTQVPCAACGAPARFVGYRPRWLRTLCGDQRVARPYYHCAACAHGTLPWDAASGLNERIFSPGLKALVAECCARLTHREVETLLSRVLGLAVEESSQQEIVGEVGARLRAAEAAQQAACFERWEALPPTVTAPPERLYLGIDAAKAHTGGAWHEVKCAVLYPGLPPPAPRRHRVGGAGAGGADPGRPPTWDRAGPKQYVACQEDVGAFGRRVYVAALEAGLAQAAQVIVLGDGADWIWNLAAEHFHGATEIVDYYHAAEHIWKLVPVLYGEGSAQGKRWAEARCQDLREHGPQGLLRALGRRRPKDPAGQEAVRLARGYFRTHRHRMEYPRFRAQGLMIGSGPVEAACKVVVGQRLKGAGMRWSTAGADAMLAVRTAVLSGDDARLARAAWAA